MTLAELIIPALIALTGTIITTIAARRFDKARSNKENSDAFLSWAKEFKSAQDKTEILLEKTRDQLEKAKDQINELEQRIVGVVNCNDLLQKELDIVKIEKTTLQERVKVLEEENIELQKRVHELIEKEKNNQNGTKHDN